jgi:hypothetical protein
MITLPLTYVLPELPQHITLSRRMAGTVYPIHEISGADDTSVPNAWTNGVPAGCAVTWPLTMRGCWAARAVAAAAATESTSAMDLKAFGMIAPICR